MEVISGEKIVKSYGKFKVLKGINLNVQDGEFVGIMGKSGSGKTTLLKILGLIESVTDGALLYKKDEISKLSDKELARIRREELGFVFQEFYLMDSLDVFEIMNELEDDLDIKLEADENIKTIQDVVTYVKKELDNK